MYQSFVLIVLLMQIIGFHCIKNFRKGGQATKRKSDTQMFSNNSEWLKIFGFYINLNMTELIQHIIEVFDMLALISRGGA